MSTTKRKTELDKMATEIVGDCKTPNMFFVSIGGRVQTVTLDFDAAYEQWRELTQNNTGVETALEDRKTGCICTKQPESDAPGARLIILDDSHMFGYRKYACSAIR